MMTDTLAYAHGGPVIQAVLRQQAEDFEVEEVLGYEPEGQGEHIYLWVEKRGLNTQYVADQLAAFAKLPQRAVSFSGLKDRHALTRQWFGVHLPGKAELDWQQLNDESLTILQVARHPRKLRRGVHKGNRFKLRLSQCQGNFAELEQRLCSIRAEGFPNYFGEQRFGRDGNNLSQARRWFKGELKAKRQQRSFYLSAARSWLFNQVLSHRVAQASWNQKMPGELLMLAGSQSVFADDGDELLPQRMAEGDIHPTGPMYGKVSSLTCVDQLAELEQQVLAGFTDLCEGLEHHGLKAERRALRVLLCDLNWQMIGDSLTLSFVLPSGCFATALVRELARYQEPDKWLTPTTSSVKNTNRSTL